MSALAELGTTPVRAITEAVPPGPLRLAACRAGKCKTEMCITIGLTADAADKALVQARVAKAAATVAAQGSPPRITNTRKRSSPTVQPVTSPELLPATGLGPRQKARLRLGDVSTVPLALGAPKPSSSGAASSSADAALAPSAPAAAAPAAEGGAMSLD